jgi:acyl carrier protein phosphodiesterase
VNFLAHCALASQHPDYLVGGFLGDFVKGPVPTHLTEGVGVGVRLHRRLDAYSAVQPDIKVSIARLPALMRRVAPVFIDLVADHFLARHFELLHTEPLSLFSNRAYATLANHSHQFPTDAHRFFRYLSDHDVFGRYVHVNSVERAFARIGERLGLDGIVMPAMAALDENYEHLEADFFRYYPALQRHADTWLAETKPAFV